MRRWLIAGGVLVIAIMVGGCSQASIAQDAAVACGWNEPDEPMVLPTEATVDQRRVYADRAERRLAAAQRVVATDDRFTALVEALEETAALANRLRDMSTEDIAAMSNDEWDFAKYVQFVARDQCEQLEVVVASE